MSVVAVTITYLLGVLTGVCGMCVIACVLIDEE